MKFLPLFFCALLMTLPAVAGPAAGEDPADNGTESSGQTVVSGLPLPRFVSTRSEQVNVRTGPGERYPVKWVLRRKGMPVEVTAEYENWRKIRDWTGTEGWVHQALLSGRRYAVIYPNDGILRAKADPIANPLARIQAGVIVRLSHCNEDWCELAVGEAEGWMNKDSLWGIYPNEKIE